MAVVVAKVRPGTSDPTGTGMLVIDCLDKFSVSDTDPFLLLHAFGPMDMSKIPALGMHPHRGFNEVPYFKQSSMFGTDPWNMNGEGEHAKIVSGQLQWGKCASGIEHGMRKDESYRGPMQGFQLWINLRAENKLDPPVFQNARSEALPVLEPSTKVKAKLLVGELRGSQSPVDTFGLHVQYVDYMIDAGGEVLHPRTAGMTSLFVYVYEGQGSFGATNAVAAMGETLNLGQSGDVSIKADQGTGLSLVLISGAPLKEPVVQHGPFVMSTQGQIMQAFEDYQRGRFLHDECEYRTYSAEGTSVTKRKIDPTYRHGRF